VKIDIPSVLLHLRAKAPAGRAERSAMATVGWVLAGRRRFELAQRLSRLGQRPLLRRGRIRWLPGKLGGWTKSRELRPVAPQSFRDWWKEQE
jgi:L-lactate dehydrogenase complex protein LldF